MTDARALVRVLLETARDLRAAGVQSFSVHPDGTMSATLLPADQPEAPAPKDSDSPFPPANPLDDPETYGGELPKRPRIFDHGEEAEE